MKGTKYLQQFLFEAFDEFFVVRCTFDILRKVLAMFDEVDASSFAYHQKDVVLRLTCCGTDHPQQASGELPLLLVGSAEPHVT
jgi:hypothetical protein